jgi:hypothetical protein
MRTYIPPVLIVPTRPTGEKKRKLLGLLARLKLRGRIILTYEKSEDTLPKVTVTMKRRGTAVSAVKILAILPYNRVSRTNTPRRLDGHLASSSPQDLAFPTQIRPSSPLN